MQRHSRPLKRKAAGLMAAMMVMTVIPTDLASASARHLTGVREITGAETLREAEKLAEKGDTKLETATPSDASFSNGTPSDARQQTQGTTYYVDAKNGNDTNDGKSEQTAWKSFDRVNEKTFLPGDKILLKADCVWNQPLMPKGSGREGAPITIAMYGDGNRPIINGNGTSGPSITGAVTIYNEEFWEIYDLEVTNLEPTDQMGETMDSGTAERAGILIYSSNQKEIYEHIVIKNCYVHDVNSSYSGGKTSGGIIVMGHYLDKDGNRVTIDDNGNLTAKAMGRAAFRDVLIEGNYVKNVAIEGIRNKCNTDIGSSGWGKNEFLKNYSNVTIRNNYLEDVVGDGIVLTETKGGLVEGNMVNSSCGFDRGNTNYAQCWTMFADNVKVQYNEAYGNKYGYDDGEAFDSDMMNINNIFQYNLSHDNGGGAMLFMASQKNTHFRYNVSINDGLGTYPGEKYMQQQTFHYDNTSSPGPNVGKIYNNTIVVFGKGKQTSLFGGKSKRVCYVDFKNNIVLAKDGANIDFAVLDQGSTIHEDSVIENNCFFPDTIANTKAGQVLDKAGLEAKGNLFADPMLVDYKAGEHYSDYVFPLENLETLMDSDFTKERIGQLTAPYQLQEGSPCIQAGQRLEDTPVEDIMGNTIAGRVDIGALERSSADETAEDVETVNLLTTPGVVPVLPKTVRVVLDGENYNYPVQWDEITKEDVMENGILEVSGTLPGLSNTATASIVIASAPESFENVQVTTYAGIYPSLPDQVTAYFEHGLEMELDVVWETLKLEDYSRAGTITVKGTVSAIEAECSAQVEIIGQMGDGTSVEHVQVSKDTYVQQDGAKPDINTIKVKTAANAPAYTRRGLVSFDLTGQEEMILQATDISVQMEMTRQGSNSYFYLKVYETEDNWAEGTALKWEDFATPSKDSLVIDDQKIVYADVEKNHNNIVTLDVTDWVKKSYLEDGQTSFSFLLVTDYFGDYGNGDNGGIDFATKEAAASNGRMAPTMVLSSVYEKSVKPLSVSTPAGKAPVLPETAVVEYSDKTEKEVKVTWNFIDPVAYQKEGVFVAYGKAEGVSLPISCTVHVGEAMHKVAAVKDLLPVIAAMGTDWEHLGLKDQVTAVLDHGQEVEIAIEYWFPDIAYDPEKAATYTCIGYLDLADSMVIENPDQKTAVVTVNIIDPEGKYDLLAMYEEASELIDQGKTEELTKQAREAFMKAFGRTSGVLLNPDAAEAEIQKAYQNMINAIESMDKEENLRPDTDRLQELVLIAESKKKEDYTEDSYYILEETLSEAKAMLKDDTLTKADQAMINETCEDLQYALDNLEFSGNGESETKSVVDIRITRLPDKTLYKVGETFSSIGLMVSAVYSDGSEKPVRLKDCEISNVSTAAAGLKDVIVTYKAAVGGEVRTFTATFRIIVAKHGDFGSSSEENSNSQTLPPSNGASDTAEDTMSGRWEMTDGVHWKFLKEDGTYAANEWGRINNRWYRFGQDGMMQTGWYLDGTTWYRLNDDGSMVTGWMETNGGWYYFDPSGAMQTGWTMINDQWYYMETGSEGTKDQGDVGILYMDTITPDGHRVNEKGIRVQ